MDRLNWDRTNELSERITQLMLKAQITEREPERLFLEQYAMTQRQDNWAKAGKFVGGGIGIATFALIDAQPDTWFHYDSQVFALVLGLIAAFTGMIATMLVGKLVMRPQIADWARRADRLAGQYDGRPSTPPSIGPLVEHTVAPPQAKSKPKPPPLSPALKVLFVFVGILRLAALAFGLSQHIGKFVGAGTALTFIAAVSLFYRPDR